MRCSYVGVGVSDMRGIWDKMGMTVIDVMGSEHWLVNHRCRLMKHYWRWIIDDWGTMDNH